MNIPADLSKIKTIQDTLDLSDGSIDNILQEFDEDDEAI